MRVLALSKAPGRAADRAIGGRTRVNGSSLGSGSLCCLIAPAAGKLGALGRQRAFPHASQSLPNPILGSRKGSSSAGSSPPRAGISPSGKMEAAVVVPRGSAVLHVHVLGTRSFSTTTPRQACEPAPNVASSAETASPDAATDALTTLADPAVYGWWPSSFAELGLVALHEATGLPWWQCISGVTLAVRTMLVPLVVYQMKNVARLALVKPEMELITKRWKALGGYSAPPQASTKYQEDLKQLFEKHDCSPGRSMIGVVVQAPLFISFFFALRRMSETYPSFKDGGALWFSDLSLVDPTYMLPVCASLTMLASIELGADTGQSMQQQQGNMKVFFRGLSVVMVPAVIIGGIPNGVFMYWITANVFSLCQVMVLKIPGLKAALGIPDVAKIQADQAAAAGQTVAGQTSAVKTPVIPTTVFASRGEARRTKGSADTPAGASAASSGAARPAAGMTKGQRVKRTPPSARKMHSGAMFPTPPHQTVRLGQSWPRPRSNGIGSARQPLSPVVTR